MATQEVTFHIVLPVLVGFVLGIIEAFFVYEDENMTNGKEFLGDMWHGLIFAIVGVFLATNVSWIISQGWIPEFFHGLLVLDENGNSLVVSIAITLIMMIKMVASHAIKGVSGSGFREKFWHKVVVSAAIGFAPYYIFFLYAPLSGLQEVIPWLPL